MTSDSNIPILAIDGPSGSGKGTVAIEISKRLNWHYLDSGAIYRVLAWLAGQNDVAYSDIDGLVALARGMELDFTANGVCFAGQNIESEIRSEQAGNNASLVAFVPEVRQALLDWQRAQARAPGLVADGRDMGTVVFPSAGVKIFLTASAEARAKRRYNQLRLKGFDVNMRALFGEIKARDERDANRAASPLKPASDAISMDSTEMTIQQVVDSVLEFVEQRYSAV